MQSLFRRGEKVLVLGLGKFSERWVDHAQQLGWEVVELKVAWGQSPSLAHVQEVAAAHPDLAGVVFTHSETSTGALIDLEEMAFALRRSHPEALLLVDAITSAGAIPYYHDDWGLDLSIAASQKALMNPAGVVAFAMSERAEQRLRPTHPGDYANLYNFAAQARRHSYPFTAPVQLLYGLRAALRSLQARTLPLVWNQNHEAAQVLRQGLAELGAQVFPAQPTDSLTAFAWEGRDLGALKAQLAERHGYELAGGQGRIKGKILRVSHLGQADAALMRSLLQALKGLAFM